MSDVKIEAANPYKMSNCNGRWLLATNRTGAANRSEYLHWEKPKTGCNNSAGISSGWRYTYLESLHRRFSYRRWRQKIHVQLADHNTRWTHPKKRPPPPHCTGSIYSSRSDWLYNPSQCGIGLQWPFTYTRLVSIILEFELQMCTWGALISFRIKRITKFAVQKETEPDLQPK